MNAIIFSAGMGTRLRPLTLDKPKGLIEVNGAPIIERQINLLKEAGIDEIVIITGYLAEQFNYLKDKYTNITIIKNDKYKTENTIYSMYLALDYLADTFILCSDLYPTKNIYKDIPKKSCYFGRPLAGIKLDESNPEWELLINPENKVLGVDKKSYSGHIMSGTAFFTKEDSFNVKTLLKKLVEEENYNKNWYWDEYVIFENLDRYDIYLKKLDSFNDILEIDNLEDLERVREVING